MITAFKATLEEVKEADCIAHIIDITSPHFLSHIEAVKNILSDLGISDLPVVRVYNKIDLLPEKKSLLNKNKSPDNHSVYASSKTGEGIPHFKDVLHSLLYKDFKLYYLQIPKSEGKVIHSFLKWSVVLKRRENENYYELKIMANPKFIINYLPYIKKGESNW